MFRHFFVLRNAPRHRNSAPETQQVVWIRLLTHHFGKKWPWLACLIRHLKQPVGFPAETDPSFVHRFRHTPEKYAKSDKIDQVWRSMPILPVKDAMLGEIDHSLMICKNSPNILMNRAPWRLAPPPRHVGRPVGQTGT